ncbi:6-hydroxymethylpterin diphosphokinase MptE-like protein [Spirochaetia bacterium 38H-sp]|uniref:6-hydroxymethylpterin diphosphokinase MptE-like protein n=1 Tax=Rarispira pelagica TaxID=3141764 RepID=A0ABU9UBL9_9SPIR
MIQEKNLITLKKSNPSAYEKLKKTSPNPGLKKENAKNGTPIPVLETPQIKKPLASYVDPQREAEKIIKRNQASGHIIITALGAAYHIEEALKLEQTEHITIIEHDSTITKALLAIRDISHILENPAVSLLVEPTKEELIDHIYSTFNPAINTKLSIIPMPQATEKAKNNQDKNLQTIRALAEQIAQETATQANFGRIWHHNCLRNLQYLSKNTTIPNLPDTIIIAAAGPSLEKTLSKLPSIPIVATDSALPFLHAINRPPILAASMDCQYYSTYHITGISPSYPLILDLSSPPAITRKVEKTILAASKHPLHQYFAEKLNIPSYPTQGNITATLTHLAILNGVTTIHIAGADYAYPHITPYQRSTYHWPYHLSRITRHANLQTALIETCLDKTPPGTITPPILTSYKNALITSLINFGCSIETPSQGHYIITTKNRSQTQITQVPSKKETSRITAQYIEKIKNLPPLKTSISYHNLEKEQKNLWTTLLPLMLYIKKHNNNKDLETISKLTLAEATENYTERSYRSK